MSLPVDSSCEGRVSLHFTQSGLSTPAAAGVVVERGSEYILTHTGSRELDGYPLGGCGSGFWFSSRLYYPFGKGPGQHIIRCSKIKSVRTRTKGMGFPVRTKGTGNTEHMFSQWRLVGTGNREQRTSHEMPRRTAGD